MKELSDDQISRQDYVDNLIFGLFQEINPTEQKLEWNIEMIGDARDKIERWFVDRLRIATSEEFYP